MRFIKYHGLGNDYLVIDPTEVGRELSPREIRLVCHRNYGPGSDGILWGPLPTPDGDFAVRIFNPDGSEAEKSGNGLRIFCRALYDRGLVKSEPFTVATLGGQVRCRVHPAGDLVDVAMGRVSFDSTRIPVAGPPREVVEEPIELLGQIYHYTAATIGNPHCVLLLDAISPELARALGPLLETDPRFPNRTNVQLLKVLSRSEIQIEIWERGAGYTLASGSSSSAAAAVARRLGRCDREISVRMPGGTLAITVADDFAVDMTGPVVKVAVGEVLPEAFTVDPTS